MIPKIKEQPTDTLSSKDRSEPSSFVQTRSVISCLAEARHNKKLDEAKKRVYQAAEDLGW